MRTDLDLLAAALEYLEEVQDDGPAVEGWQSDELKALCREIRERLGT